MASIRETNKTALLIVDMQVDVIDSAWDEAGVIANVGLAVKRACERDIPIIWVQHTNRNLVHGSPEWQLVPELTPHSDDIFLNKQFNSAFEKTTLDETLASLEISHIVLAGALTNWCIQSTAYAILDKGYDLTLISDAHTTGDIVLENGETIKALDIIREFNIVIAAVHYPGRTSRVIDAKDLVF